MNSEVEAQHERLCLEVSSGIRITGEPMDFDKEATRPSTSGTRTCSKPVILIDTREQRPLEFSLPTVRATLRTGDYSIQGLEDLIAIERKSADDLVGSLSFGRDRFERELRRGSELDYFALIIEASLQDLAMGRYRSRMLPKAVVQSLLAFSVRYRLPVFFAEDRRYAARLTEGLLLKFYREKHPPGLTMDSAPTISAANLH